MGKTKKNLDQNNRVPAEIRADRLPNTSLEHYRCANPLYHETPDDIVAYLLKAITMEPDK
jgi:hypothetical protein